MLRALGLSSFIVLAVAGIAEAGGRFPWRLRVGKNVDSVHVTAHKNTPLELWPKELESPAPVEPDRFEEALKELCAETSPVRVKRYSTMILEEARRFEVDPFLLGALVYDQSRCWPHTPKREEGLGRFGMTRIAHSMHALHIRGGRYKYFVKGSDDFEERELDLSLQPYNIQTLKKPASNLFFAAAILKVLAAQDADLDASFSQAPHRHFVSHWFYGDRVLGAEPENRVLTARRRLVSYYAGAHVAKAGSFMGNDIVSPLDGAPRLVLDYFGNPRGKKGVPGHRGIDIDAAEGEPVRALAAGRVTFAGTDEPGAKNHRQLTAKEAAKLSPDDMGPGGLYVSINHKNDFGTIYMHLSSLSVEYNDDVAAGQIIGAAGKTGARTSGTHLHLEFRVGTDRVDPAKPLAAVLVDPHIDEKKRKKIM